MGESGKRIAVHMHTLYNGGVERVMINLMQGFLDCGHGVELVVDFLDYSPFERLLPEGTEVVRLGAYGFRHRLPRLMKYMRERHFDFTLLGLLLGIAFTLGTVFLGAQSFELMFLLFGWAQAVRPHRELAGARVAAVARVETQQGLTRVYT